MTEALQVAILLFPGSNREGDAARALAQATGRQPTIVWHDESILPPGTDLVVLPGGFSYGDYLRCGAIAARAHIMDAVRTHAAHGGLVLGICNGFQILCESGLLPGVLLRNAGQRFLCKMQYLQVSNTATSFTKEYRTGQVIKVAIAHGEGNYFADSGGDRRIGERWTGSVPVLQCRRADWRSSQSERLNERYRRCLQQKLQCFRAHAAPRKLD